MAAGFDRRVGPVGTPEGPATVLADPSGTSLALLGVDRPGAMDDAYGTAAEAPARPAP